MISGPTGRLTWTPFFQLVDKYVQALIFDVIFHRFVDDFGSHLELIFHYFAPLLPTFVELDFGMAFSLICHAFRYHQPLKNHVFTAVLQCFLRVWHIRKPDVFSLDFYMDSDMFLDAFGYNFNTF